MSFLLGAFATLTFFGLCRLAFHRRRWHAHGRCGGYGRHPRGMGRERFARAAGEVFKRRLDVDEEQEPIVDHALADARAALKELADELAATRGAVADALRGESVDDAALAAAFAKHDDAVARARRAVVSAVKQVHAVLEPEQRARAADWIASKDTRWM
ncbi:MAG: periplasmic heavy metal sensor [Myxococcota bacterium]